MTTPAGTDMPVIPPAPAIVADPLLETLPGAVVAQQESSTVLRIGVVAAIIEGSQITVRISGSEVLLDCSYLFYQYFPLLGDRVIVLKQDSQWICLGQMSGPIGSNNLLFNPSFELGTIGALPSGWTITPGLVGAGVPTFTAAGGLNISGVQTADFGTDSVGAGVSSADVFSAPVSAVPGSKWTGGYFLMQAFVGSIYPMFHDLDMHIQFLDGAGALIIDHEINHLSVGADVAGTLYRRLSLTAFPDGFVVAPAGTSSVRVRFVGIFELPAASFVSFFIDNVILRQVD
jgi:hypothetical protein